MGRSSDPDEAGAAISRIVARWVGHDGLRLVGTSPATGLGLGSFSFWHGYEPEFIGALALNRYLHGDPCPPVALARRPVPVGQVGQVDQPAGAARQADDDGLRVRELLAAHGVSYELRLVLRDARGVWGLLGLLRVAGSRPFDAADAERAARLGSVLIAALRHHVTAGPLTPSSPALPAGLIVVGADHTLRAITPHARAWLDQLRRPERSTLPAWVAEAALLGLSLDTRRRARDPLAWRPLVCTPAVGFGRWVAIEGQPLGAGDDGDVGILIQAATGALLLPSFCDWYGITPRERAVIELLYSGEAPKQIARRLDLSPHTVNDHLKAVFRKTGARGRNELVAALTA